jgi:predicted amidohydrolase
MKVSLIQIDSRDNKEENFSKAMKFAQKSLANNPDIICLSERFLYWGNNKVDESEEISSQYIQAFQDFAKTNKANLILGSVALKSNKNNKVTNTALVINREGKIIHKYNKIYMFNVNKKGIVVKESDTTLAGDALGIVMIDNVKIGIGICYDLRYPEYFQELAKKGAEIIFLPSNFRKKTGLIAWENLTRARAIENQVYFCACDQTGESGIKERCGNTRIISYDGTIIKNIETKEGIISADLDLEALRKFRKGFPVLKQIKSF